MDGDYILPGEFIALILFWFGVPLLLAFIPLSWLLVSRGLFRKHMYRTLGAYVLTIVLSIIVGLGFLIWLPPSLNFVGVRDIFFAGQYLPLLPLSFLTVAVVSPFVGWWALRAVRPNHSIKRDALKRARYFKR